jgi:pyrimidine operon attenuation protein/uracil phosphoribosyltransferase
MVRRASSSVDAGHDPGRRVLDAEDISRAIKRIAHEVLERNKGPANMVIIGIHTRGVPLAERLGREIESIEGHASEVGAIDVSFYRDDIGIRRPKEISQTQLPFDVSGQVVVLVDDVLFTGRTIRAAIDALVDFGRPKTIQLAVLMDRGHRELPIRPDYVGKNIPTSLNEQVRVHLKETDGVDEVVILEEPA